MLNKIDNQDGIRKLQDGNDLLNFSIVIIFYSILSDKLRRVQLNLLIVNFRLNLHN